MIPPYESNEYLSSTTSYVSDDYYGILNDGDGGLMNGSIKVGIGRLPVVTAAQASVVLNKIERYYSLNDSTLADWKNTITFVADDPDGNYHLKQAEQLADTVRRKYPVFNVNKIYNDAYQMTSTPSGMRSPECEKAINKSVCNGGMVLSYTGHGGEEGWSSTKILTIPDINSWNNYYRLPVFITATCEFSRFDNPNRPTGGELVILKPDGGGVALFTTTRKAFGAANIQLSATFFSILMSVTDGLNPRLGDLIRVSKDSNNNSLYLRNFVLLGDPAVDILFARQKAVTTYINDHPLDGSPDTVLGLSKVTIRGEIQDSQGNKLTNFNGIVYPKVFDKPVTYSTIGNTPASYPQGFQLQNHVLFSGKSTVTHGDFQFTFFVPRGVALPFGKGKISYYAQDLQTDAKGYTTEMVVGGVDSNADSTVKGPEIGMFMDSTTFVSGDRTGPDPVLLAFLNDNTGINHQDLGIGHDITAILDNDDSHPILLNSYFEPALDDYTSGSIHFPFAGLSPGFHSLRLKVWNVYDVSSEKEIYFWVMDQKLASIQNVKNYPNPFQTGTTFAFTPMNASGDLDVQVLIYAYTGQLVKTIQKHFTESSSTTSLIIEWDGNGDNGVPLHTGIYLYRVIIRGSNGTLAQTSQKLVILR